MKTKITYLFILISLIVSGLSFGQGEIKYITFSGLVIDSQTKEPLPGAYITIPRAGRGTLSNSKGYFVLGVFPGDTVIFSYLGFKKQFHIIPKKTEIDYSVFVELQVDSKMLKEVKVYPFSTEEEFKQALVDMKLPDDRERKILQETYSPENIAKMASVHGMSADANYRYGQNQFLKQMESRGQVTMNPLLNPFAWVNFVKSVKSGAWKDKAWKAGANTAPSDNVTRDEFFRNSTKKN
ncbi:carboxypeptidase-like regulatory domain-containing protein [Emticicia sp. SJ17W-69]|uniref:carboxypeptidase-like regulatory domain-containing protein n=1 Tax=Emticicia sp. SJ17W-69 TaxID=3421657 RepID=UPI003EBF5F10